jgi:phosphotransferase system enzyme I (PtsI)
MPASHGRSRRSGIAPSLLWDGRAAHPVLINVDDPERLKPIDPASCDGVGLTRTEFLFHGRDGFPDEETQFAATGRSWNGLKAAQ